MKEFTCEDCKNVHTNPCFPFGEVCANFETEDGERPRFCRLASSAEEMAEAMITNSLVAGAEMWTVIIGRTVFPSYDTREEAIAAAKAWLLEV